MKERKPMSDDVYYGGLLALIVAFLVIMGAMWFHYRHHCCSSSVRERTVTVQRCTWGASSLGPVVIQNGHVLKPLPKPHRTGCIPG